MPPPNLALRSTRILPSPKTQGMALMEIHGDKESSSENRSLTGREERGRSPRRRHHPWVGALVVLMTLGVVTPALAAAPANQLKEVHASAVGEGAEIAVVGTSAPK